MKFMQLSRIHIAHATKHKSCISRNSMQHVGAYLPTHLLYNCHIQEELSPTVSPKQLFSKSPLWIILTLNGRRRTTQYLPSPSTKKPKRQKPSASILSPCTGEWGRTSRLFGDAHHGQVSDYWTGDLGDYEEVNDDQITLLLRFHTLFFCSLFRATSLGVKNKMRLSKFFSGSIIWGNTTAHSSKSRKEISFNLWNSNATSFS